MAPWDENKETEPYRDYEKGGPADYWLYQSLQRAAGNFAAGTGILPYKPDEIGWSSASSKETPEQQRAAQKADAELFRSLPVPVTWADIVRLYAERYPDEDGAPLLSEDGSRAYTMSTYNPESKWDYWRIGGRWGGYFPHRKDSAALVIRAERAWDSPDDIMPLHCDGGPKSALDLKGMRKEKAARPASSMPSTRKSSPEPPPPCRGRRSMTTSPRATATTPIRPAPSTTPSRESRRSGAARRSSGTTM